MNTLCEQEALFLNAAACGTYIYHCFIGFQNANRVGTSDFRCLTM